LSDQPERESYDAIGLIDRDWRDESLSTLDGLARAIWTDWGQGGSPTIRRAARKQGRLSHFPSKRKAARSPNRHLIAIPGFPG
jgi:hypothetical protein